MAAKAIALREVQEGDVLPAAGTMALIALPAEMLSWAGCLMAGSAVIDAMALLAARRQVVV